MSFEPIDVTIKNKDDARKIVRLCFEGEPVEAWKEEFSHYVTAKGQIRMADYERACDILRGFANHEKDE